MFISLISFYDSFPFQNLDTCFPYLFLSDIPKIVTDFEAPVTKTSLNTLQDLMA